MSAAPVVVVGDALLDRDVTGSVGRVCPDAPVPVVDVDREAVRPGGAALAAALVAGDRREVVLVTALGDDAAGRELAALLRTAGVAVVDLGDAGPTAEKVRVRAAGQSVVRVDRGGARGRPGDLTDDARDALGEAAAVLVADYGRGVTDVATVRSAVASLPRRVPVVWDPHPRGPAPVPGVHLATPNGAEATALVPQRTGDDLAAVHARARMLVERWSASGVVVTLGDRGALLTDGAPIPLMVPPPASAVVPSDSCGAGDRFASAAAVALAGGAVLSEAVTAAVGAASAFVVAGGAAGWSAATTPQPVAPAPSPAAVPPAAVPPAAVTRAAVTRAAPAHRFGVDAAREVVDGVRRNRGTVVATGGCFDLLHAGHVATLRTARSLGDCLVVLVNSDASVRRLKGDGRPYQPHADRAAVLAALDCVDAVVVFDDDTPVPTLTRLRPDVFAKGGDYAVGDLPEAGALATWGGQAVVLPYLDGRSTTRLVQEVLRRAR